MNLVGLRCRMQIEVFLYFVPKKSFPKKKVVDGNERQAEKINKK